MAEAAKMIRVYIRRAEGPIQDPTMQPATFEGDSAEEQGNDWLRRIARTAPKEGGYDKTDVEIELDSGDVFKSRFDVHHWSLPNNDTDLRAHYRNYLLFCCAPEKIPHIAAKPERLKAARSWVNDNQRREARRVLGLLCPQEVI